MYLAELYVNINSVVIIQRDKSKSRYSDGKYILLKNRNAKPDFREVGKYIVTRNRKGSEEPKRVLRQNVVERPLGDCSYRYTGKV